MEISLLLAYAQIVWREIWSRKFLCVFIFAVTSFAVMGVGKVFPVKFQTSTTVFADNQNILQPLLKNQAAQSKVLNQSRIVRDIMHSPRTLQKVVTRVFSPDEFESAEDVSAKVNAIRARLLVEGLGSNYIKITYTDNDPDTSYRVLNAVVDIFIRDSSETQRSESRQAFSFIDSQVNQYKDQLVLAESKLKAFNSQNFDGRDANVDGAIAKIRGDIESLKISIEEDQTKIKSLQLQVSQENEFSPRKYKASVYTERLLELESRLSTMLLTYKENYPDVVTLKYQIEDVKKTIREAEESPEDASEDADSVNVNPLYQELRSRLSQTKVNLQAKERRLKSMEALLEGEFERRKRIASRAAEEAELTRDYDVTKKIYEEMLQRREKARLSMTLNVEGQGISYRIQEPSIYPIQPASFTFVHFVIAGPVLGCLFIIGLFVVYIFVDQKIRMDQDLLELEGVKVLAVVPPVHRSIFYRLFRLDSIIFALLSLGILAAYAYVALQISLGVF